jgi:SPP1 family predicted phage head-tail adaptor
MRAGKLRHQVSVQSATDTTDGRGSTTQSWSTVTTVWASVEPISGRELLRGDQVAADVTHRVRLRAPGLTLTPRHRLLFGSRHLAIDRVINVEERGEEYELLCHEVV